MPDEGQGSRPKITFEFDKNYRGQLRGSQEAAPSPVEVAGDGTAINIESGIALAVDSAGANGELLLKQETSTDEKMARIRELKELAKNRAEELSTDIIMLTADQKFSGLDEKLKRQINEYLDNIHKIINRKEAIFLLDNHVYGGVKDFLKMVNKFLDDRIKFGHSAEKSFEIFQSKVEFIHPLVANYGDHLPNVMNLDQQTWENQAGHAINLG